LPAHESLDSVGSQLPFPELPLFGRNGFLVAHEIGYGRLAAEREIHAKKIARTQSGKG
jgi:hypothetical protein